MTKLINSVAAALIASVAMVGGAAAAEGEYYEGISPRQDKAQSLIGAQTRSFGFHVASEGKPQAKPRAAVDSGDYYEGATRPH